MSIPGTNNNSTNMMNEIEDVYHVLDKSRWWRACLAGSIAGLSEHSILYPVDTLKTRMQAVLISDTIHYRSFAHAFTHTIRNENVRALFRGLPAVLTAAIPSHAAYFGIYEYTKFRLHVQHQTHQPLKIAIAGAFATAAHDLVVTPFDVIKQRMQLQNCPYANVCKCAFDTYKKQGYLSFIRSYPTTVLLNIPVFCTNLVVYESSKLILRGSIFENEGYWAHYLIAGGLAGAVSGLISNPLDIIKTSIQTDVQSNGYKTIARTMNELLLHNNQHWDIFFRGASARIFYMIPSASITWTTYEAFKHLLGFNVSDLERI